MNIANLGFLAGILVGAGWGFSVGYQHGPVFALIGALIGLTAGIAGAAMTVACWVSLMVLWERSKLKSVLPEAVSGLLVITLSLFALAGVPLLLVWLSEAALRTVGLAGGS